MFEIQPDLEAPDDSLVWRTYSPDHNDACDISDSSDDILTEPSESPLFYEYIPEKNINIDHDYMDINPKNAFTLTQPDINDICVGNDPIITDNKKISPKKYDFTPQIIKDFDPLISKELNQKLRLLHQREKEQRAKEMQINALEQKERKSLEHMQMITHNKIQKIAQNNTKVQQRAEIANQKKAQQEYEYRFSAFSRILKANQVEERKEQVKKSQEFALNEKAAERWLKSKIAAQISKQAERRKFMIAKSKLEKDEAQIKRIEEEKEAKKQSLLFKKRILEKALMSFNQVISSH